VVVLISLIIQIFFSLFDKDNKKHNPIRDISLNGVSEKEEMNYTFNFRLFSKHSKSSKVGFFIMVIGFLFILLGMI
jgi:hypothetical protein